MDCRLAVLICVLIALPDRIATPAAAQDAHEKHSAATHGAIMSHDTSMPNHSANADHGMMMTGLLGIPRSRTGSGTSWLPDSSPMYGLMASAGDWMFMFHENIFVGYDWFGSERGGQRLISVNSLMAMAVHPLGPGEISARVMLSAEPLTVGKRGYPLILQTGETVGGLALHDRQHPHDLFMELALDYSVALTNDIGLQLYVAPAGEPALGPTAFPHRVSAMSDPLAPIGHHWQDSTHISFGVVTLGVFTRQLKLEGSWFNGREPDERRWDIDLRVPDSFSGRITWNPNMSWSLQASHGYLASPETLDTSISINRTTFSASYDYRASQHGNWATTLIFGANTEREEGTTPSFLLESNWNIDGHHDVFGRLEYLRKAGRDLVVVPALETRTFDLASVGLGYAYYFGPVASFSPALGVRGSLAVVDAALDSAYGTRTPLGFMVFAELRPVAVAMH